MSAKKLIVILLIVLIICLSAFIVYSYINIKNNSVSNFRVTSLINRIASNRLTTKSEQNNFRIIVNDNTLSSKLSKHDKFMEIVLKSSPISRGNNVYDSGNLIVSSEIKTNESTDLISMNIYLSPLLLQDLNKSSIIMSDLVMEVFEKLENPEKDYEQSETKKYLRDNAESIDRLPINIKTL